MMYVTKPDDFNPRFEVVCCHIHYNEKVLLLKRHPLKPQGRTWGVPGGKIDKDEDSQTAILRELQEETGIEAGRKQISFAAKVYVRYPEYDFVYHIFHLPLSEEPVLTINKEEHTDHIWVTPKKALTMDLIPDEDNCIRLIYRI